MELIDGEELPAVVLELEQLCNAVHALSAAVLDKFQTNGGWAVDGALSAAAWTAERTGSARAGLRSRVRQGAAMKLLPTVAAEAYAGRLSTEHLRAMSDCARRHPQLAADHELVLLEQAKTLKAEGFRLATRHWLAAAEDQVELEPTERAQVSTLHTSRTFEGWLRIDGLLAPHDADLVEAALDAGVDRALRDARDGDPSVEGQPVSALRAAALVDLAAQAMRHEPSDASVPDRYRVAVIVRAGEPAIPAEAACDAPTYRVGADRRGRGPRCRPADVTLAGRDPPGHHDA